MNLKNSDHQPKTSQSTNRKKFIQRITAISVLSAICATGMGAGIFLNSPTQPEVDAQEKTMKVSTPLPYDKYSKLPSNDVNKPKTEIAPEIKKILSNNGLTTAVSDQAIASTTYRTGATIVKLSTDSLDEANTLIQSLLGTDVAYSVEPIGNSYFSVIIEIEGGQGVQPLDELDAITLASLEKLQSSDQVLSAEPDVMYYAFQEEDQEGDTPIDLPIVEPEEDSDIPSPKEPLQQDQWYLDNVGQDIILGSDTQTGVEDQDIDYSEAVEYMAQNPQDNTVIVAVIDDGVDITHPDLINKLYKDADGNLVGYDFITGKPYQNPTGAELIGWGHGTHVAGAIAAERNGEGIQGVCDKCLIMPIRFLGNGGGGASAGAKSIYYAVANGAQVINASWGGGYPTQVLEDAIDYARDNGVLFVAAAGNYDGDYTFFPAGYESAISVAASDNSGKKASFSSYNDAVDVIAPGERILSTLPIGGDLYRDATEEGEPNKCEDRNQGLSNDGYGYCSGTSMASPIVAGIAGVLMHNEPDAPLTSIRARLTSTTTDLVETEPRYKGKIGSGLVNLNNALAQEQEITLGDATLNIDDTEYGNGDNQLQPGENVTAVVTIPNLWQALTSVEGTLTSEDSNVFIGSDTARASDINSGDTIVLNYELGVNQALIRGYQIPLKLTLDVDGEGFERNLDLMVTVIYTNEASWDFEESGLDWTAEGDFGYYQDCPGTGETRGKWHNSTESCETYSDYGSGTLTSPVFNFDKSAGTTAYIDITHKVDMEILGAEDKPFYPDYVNLRVNDADDESKFYDKWETTSVTPLCGETICNTDGFVTHRFFLDDGYNKYLTNYQAVLEFDSDLSGVASGWSINSVKFGVIKNESPEVTTIKDITLNQVSKAYTVDLDDYITITDDYDTEFSIRGYHFDSDIAISNIDKETHEVTIKALKKFTGIRNYYLTVTDSMGGETDATLKISLANTANNKAPTISKPDLKLSIDEPTNSLIVVDLVKEAGISDPEGDKLTYTITSVGGSATSFIDAKGVLSVRADGEGNKIKVDYVVSDSYRATRKGTVTITIKPNTEQTNTKTDSDTQTQDFVTQTPTTKPADDSSIEVIEE